MNSAEAEGNRVAGPMQDETVSEAVDTHAREKSVIMAALAFFGRESRVDLLCEEAGELAEAIGHYKRGRCGLGPVAEEAADVSIVLDQLAEAYGPEHVSKARDAFPAGVIDADPLDWARECCAAAQAELMLARRGATVPLLICITLGKAQNAVAHLVDRLGAQAFFVAHRTAKIERLCRRIAEHIDSGSARWAAGAGE